MKIISTCAFTFLISLLFCSEANAAITFSSKDSIVKKCVLDMKGRVMFGKKGLDSTLITVYADSSMTLVQKVESEDKGLLMLRLPIGKFYTINISKQGYVTKILTVDTHMPKSFQTGDYYFEFTADLLEDIEGMDISMLKRPVAKIFFNSFSKKFDYDYNYTAKINNDMKKLYENYKTLKRKQDAVSTLHKDVGTIQPADTIKK